MYADATGKEVRYTYGDLKYDIVCGFLQDPRDERYLRGQVEGAWYMGHTTGEESDGRR